MEPKRIAYFRNFIFGVEDSLVSTVGLLSGVAIAGLTPREIFLTGVILIFVEAFSMGAGSYLSETSAEELATRKDDTKRSFASALIMFVSYAVSGFIPLLPYLVMPVASAFPASIIASLIALLVLGILSAKVSRTSMLRDSIRMVAIGGFAIAVGVLVGKLVA